MHYLVGGREDKTVDSIVVEVLGIMLVLYIAWH